MYAAPQSGTLMMQKSLTAVREDYILNVFFFASVAKHLTSSLTFFPSSYNVSLHLSCWVFCLILQPYFSETLTAMNNLI